MLMSGSMQPRTAKVLAFVIYIVPFSSLHTGLCERNHDFLESCGMRGVVRPLWRLHGSCLYPGSILCLLWSERHQQLLLCKAVCCALLLLLPLLRLPRMKGVSAQGFPDGPHCYKISSLQRLGHDHWTVERVGTSTILCDSRFVR